MNQKKYEKLMEENYTKIRQLIIQSAHLNKHRQKNQHDHDIYEKARSYGIFPEDYNYDYEEMEQEIEKIEQEELKARNEQRRDYNDTRGL